MPFGNFLLALALLQLAWNSKPRHYPLPPSAVITIGPTQQDPKAPNPKGFCSYYHLSQEQVREQFRTYHQLREMELEHYLYMPCWIEGTVTVNGKTYTWQSRDGNTMGTDWPDGKGKTLVGKPSDDLSDGKDPNWDKEK